MSKYDGEAGPEAMAQRVQAAIAAAKDAIVCEVEVAKSEGADDKALIGIALIAATELFSDALTAVLMHPEPGRSSLAAIMCDLIGGATDDDDEEMRRGCVISKIGALAALSGRLTKRDDGMAEVRL